MNKCWRGAVKEKDEVGYVDTDSVPEMDFGVHYTNYTKQLNSITSFFGESITPDQLANLAFDSYKNECENQLKNFTLQIIFLNMVGVMACSMGYRAFFHRKTAMPKGQSEAFRYHQIINLKAATKYFK